MNLGKKLEEAAMNTRAAARYLGVSIWLLRNTRKTSYLSKVARQEAPAFPQPIRVGRDQVYLKAELDRYLAQQIRERDARLKLLGVAS